VPVAEGELIPQRDGERERERRVREGEKERRRRKEVFRLFFARLGNSRNWSRWSPRNQASEQSNRVLSSLVEVGTSESPSETFLSLFVRTSQEKFIFFFFFQKTSLVAILDLISLANLLHLPLQLVVMGNLLRSHLHWRWCL